MATYTIDLQNFRVTGSKVFTGRDRGEQVRIASKIDSRADEFEKIIVSIPNDVYSINPSFLEEFLVNVVLKLGKNGFNKKFEFISMGDYSITLDLAEAIDRIVRTENALV